MKRKNAGFTLLELVVVVAVMGLISTMAMDVYTDHSNQKRFEVTKKRLAEIKFAIIGDPMMRVGSQVVLSGFYNDMKRQPKSIDELISDTSTSGGEYCENSNGDEASTYSDKSTCEAVTDHHWVEWQGPYLHNLQSSMVFKDGWGREFLWPDASTYSTSGNLIISSYGLNGLEDSSLSTNVYENDISRTIFYSELTNIDAIKALRAPEYCVDTTTAEVYTAYTTSAGCTAAGITAGVDYIWVTFPSMYP